MKIQSYDKIGEQVHSERLPNGLSVFVIPKRGYNKSFAFFAANYGGADRRFLHSGRWIDTPEGVAHFLEHKMFDTEDGNALTDLSANGASPNAFTSSSMTAYHFESTEKFYENLGILLKFVSVPYFTDESVGKEQGIIGQEIRMTEDEPDYAVYYGLMKALYKSHPLRDSVAGTVESISEITADTLYACHNVFYNPSNMVLCVAGDVDPAKVVKTALGILPREAGEVPRRDYGSVETLTPEKNRAETLMEVSQPIFLFGGKASPQKNGEEYLRQELAGNLALEYIIGKSSPLYARLYKERLINRDFSAAFESSAGAAHFVCGGESRDPDAVFAAFSARAGEITAGGIDEELFRRIKKTAFGREMRAFNSFENICYGYATGYFRGYDAFRSPGVLSELTPDDIMAFIRGNMSPEKLAISIINPKKSTDV